MLLAVATACGSTAGGSDDGGDGSSADGVSDGLGETTDGRGDDGPTDDGTTADSPADIPPYDAAVGHLEPEGETETYFTTESGSRVGSYASSFAVAYSGRLYGLALSESETTAPEEAGPAVFRLIPGGTVLERAWSGASLGIDVARASICWTGEVFLAVFSTDEAGSQVVAVGEDGVVRAGPTAIEDGVIVLALCPSSGPVLLAPYATGEDRPSRLYLATEDGFLMGETHDVALPEFATNASAMADVCTAAGEEVACVLAQGGPTDEPGRIAFINRAGDIRYSPPIPRPAGCANHMGCDLAWTGDGLAAAWVDLGTDDKAFLVVGRTNGGGEFVVGPSSTGRLTAVYFPGVHLATSDDTMLVVSPNQSAAVAPGVGPWAPDVTLLDAYGRPLGASVSLVRECEIGMDPPCSAQHNYSGLGVFWEGDGYAALWGSDRLAPVEHAIAYRRFRVVPGP